MRDDIKKEVSQLQQAYSPFSSYTDREDKSQGGAIVGSDIYKLFNSLYDVFRSLDLITEEPTDTNTFKFIHAYPDEIKKEGMNVITFRVKSRAPAVSLNKAVPQTSFTSSTPRAVEEGYNEVTGMYETIYCQDFDNIISLTIFASKARAVNLLAQILESVFIKYKKAISIPASKYTYLGMGDVGFLDRDSQDPIFTRELSFHFITTEVLKMEEEQIKKINLTI